MSSKQYTNSNYMSIADCAKYMKHKMNQLGSACSALKIKLICSEITPTVFTFEARYRREGLWFSINVTPDMTYAKINEIYEDKLQYILSWKQEIDESWGKDNRYL